MGNVAYQKKKLSGSVGKTVPISTVAVKWAIEIMTQLIFWEAIPFFYAYMFVKFGTDVLWCSILFNRLSLIHI